MITITNKVRKEADRVGGVLLALPWPASLPAPTATEPTEWDATAAEHAVVASLLPDLRPFDLVHARSVVLVDSIHPSAALQAYLGAILIGRRWVHASTKLRPKLMWSIIAAQKP